MMTITKIRFACMCLWLVAMGASLAAVVMGNWAHMVFVAISACIAWWTFNDDSRAESVRGYMTRKLKLTK